MEKENLLSAKKEPGEKYEINNAVWIAAAILILRSYRADKIATRDDLYFKQAEIAKLAALYADGYVDRTRCSFLCCAGQEKSVNCYLRGDNEKDPSLRRLTMMGELEGKTYPKELNPADRLEVDGDVITVGELFAFVKNIYPTIYNHVSCPEQVCPEQIYFEQISMRGDEGKSEEYEKEKYVNSAAEEGEWEPGQDWEAYKNLILYGPPGTGKTYMSAVYAVAFCDGKPLFELTDYSKVMERYRELKKQGRIVFTTFHPSYSYEEFIEGIRPVVDRGKDSLSYAVEPGIFKKFCALAAGSGSGGAAGTRKEIAGMPYVFIIDEINRGNISKIFGELITLIENSKRAGEKEAVSAVLPYSGEEFSVPKNVYLIGTLNSADRSVALMDTALRRRFRFVEMMPQPQVLRQLKADRVGELDVADMLEVINGRLTYLYDREHTIGHAFFTGLTGENATLEKLGYIFETAIFPLLQEYFYEDYEKIQLVLGDNAKSCPELKFIRDDTVCAGNIFKGNASGIIDLSGKIYTINKSAFLDIDSYKEIL